MLLALGYTAYAGYGVYSGLDKGRTELAAAQAQIAAAQRSGDSQTLLAVQSQLQQAERDFNDAGSRAHQDPALRLVSALPAARTQLDAGAHLAAIGADLTRAGEGATTIAVRVAALRQQYANRRLTPDDLQAILQQAQAVATNYKGSIAQIGQQLKAAHQERAQVGTGNLLPPLKSAYDEVDRALSDADTAFVRYQDVRQVLSDLLGVRI